MSLDRFCHPDQFVSVPMLPVQIPGRFVARKDRERHVTATMFPGPLLGICDQRAAHTLTAMCRRDDEVGDVAIQGAGEEILLRLQVQEPESFAVFVFGDEQVRGGWQFAQVPGYVGPYSGEGLAALAPMGQIETRQTLCDGENEVIVIGMGETDVRR